MNWLILAISSALFAACVNFIDKYLISNKLKGSGIGSLVMFSSLIGLPVVVGIAVMHPEALLIPLNHAIWMVLNGMIFVAWVLPYFYALNKDDASVVAPLFQLSVVFSLILGYLFLGDSISLVEGIAAALIMLASLGIGVEWDGNSRKLHIKIEVIALMTLATLLIAINNVIFKGFALEYTFWTTSFWEYFGFFVMAILLFCLVPNYRRQFKSALKSNGVGILSLNFVNECLALAAKMLANYATLFIAVGLVKSVTEGTQMLFVLGLGVVLTLLLPNIIKEKIHTQYLMQKVIAIGIMIFGLFLLQ